MDANTAIKELKQLLEDVMIFDDCEYHANECETRVAAITYAIESIESTRYSVAKESEE